MRFLVDESCDFAAARSLRAAGHDVLAVCEITQGSVDHDLVLQAKEEDRILLTEDKDFGWLVFVSHLESPGVVLLRYPGTARASLANDIVRLVAEQAEKLHDSFVVLQPGQVRISRRPTQSK
jgi:predicted nuclease of predicted toxin-antitoxin system